MGEFVSEGQLQLEISEDFVDPPPNFLLVGTGEVHRRGVDGSEDAAVVRCGHSVAVSRTTIDPDD
jgi:hypothetical protein